MSEAVNPLPLIKDKFIMEVITKNPGYPWGIMPYNPSDPVQVEFAKSATAGILDAIINKTMGVSNE